MREEENSTKSESMCCGATKTNMEGSASEQKSKSLGNVASIVSEKRSDKKSRIGCNKHALHTSLFPLHRISRHSITSIF